MYSAQTAGWCKWDLSMEHRFQSTSLSFKFSSLGTHSHKHTHTHIQPCCTVYSNDGYWYRAELSGLPSPDIAEVTYIDYGNSGQVPRESLRRPKPHYLALPAQAIRCRLANVKPAGSVSGTDPGLVWVVGTVSG